MGKQKSKKSQKRDILDIETLQYYHRISHELKQGFDDDENKGKWRDGSLSRRTTTPHVICGVSLKADRTLVWKTWQPPNAAVVF